METSHKPKDSAAKRVAVVVLLGAIGSGAWSLLGEPLIQVIGSGAVRLIAWFSTTYLETVYSEVGMGLHENSALTLQGLFTGAFVMFWVAIPIDTYGRWKRLSKRISLLKANIKAIKEGDISKVPPEEETPEEVIADATRFTRQLRAFFGISVVVAPVAVTILLADAYRNSYLVSASVYLERSIEIVAPHLSGNEYLRLRASYRSITTREQFMRLHQQLVEDARINSVQLPAFSPL